MLYVTHDARFTNWVTPYHQTARHPNYALRTRVNSTAQNDPVVSGLTELDAFWWRIGVLREGISEFLLPNNDFLKPEFGLHRKWVKASILHSRTHTSDASRNLGVSKNPGQTRPIARRDHAYSASGCC